MTDLALHYYGRAAVWESMRELRWILPDTTTTHQPILQQAWRDLTTGRVEWRKVPLQIVSAFEFSAALTSEAPSTPETE